MRPRQDSDDCHHPAIFVIECLFLVVVTIYEGRHLPVDANIGTRINARLTAAAAKGSVHLVDWNAAVHRDPGLIVADGIHPDLGGQRWIARSIRDAVDSDC